MSLSSVARQKSSVSTVLILRINKAGWFLYVDAVCGSIYQASFKWLCLLIGSSTEQLKQVNIGSNASLKVWFAAAPHICVATATPILTACTLHDSLAQFITSVLSMYPHCMHFISYLSLHIIQPTCSFTSPYFMSLLKCCISSAHAVCLSTAMQVLELTLILAETSWGCCMQM